MRTKAIVVMKPAQTILSNMNEIQTGEIYGKQTNTKFVMYSVLKVIKGKSDHRAIVTLQNIDNPLSLFETTGQKLHSSGYILISQTPYINPNITGNKKRKAARKPSRCPHTLDFIEDRADTQRPAPIMPDLFAN